MVEVKIYTVTGVELTRDLHTLEHQRVHLGGDIELVCLSGLASITGVILAELAQGTFYRIRTCYSDAVAVPEGLDVHNILDAVSSREVAAKQLCEDVAVTESEKSAARSEGPVDDTPYTGLVQCFENWK